MKFRIRAILWVFALLASALATFGGFGILFTGGIFCLLGLAVDLRPLNFFTWLVIWIVSFVLLIYATPYLGKLGTTYLQNKCKANLESIAQAVLAYEAKHGHFPPPYTKDESGQILHSWRVLILPYLGQQTLYDSIHLEEPWDSKHNQQFWEQMPSLYRCPTCKQASEMGAIDCLPQTANYYGIVGENTIWSNDEKIRLKDVVDKWSSLSDSTPSSTLLLMEYTPKNGCWMQPVDLTAIQAANVLRGRPSTHLTIESGSPLATVSASSVNVAYASGSVTTFLAEGVERVLEDFPNFAEFELERNGDRIFWSGVEMKQRQPLTEKEAPEILKPIQFSGYIVQWSHLYSLLVLSFLSTLPLADFARRT